VSNSNQDMVSEFHKKNGYPTDHDLATTAWIWSATITIRLFSKVVLFWVKSLQKAACRYQKQHDARLYRLCLIMEEAAEIGLGLSKGDEIEVADGLADLLYVTYGTGVTYWIPLDECFKEVHRANMSKKTRDEKADPRMRDKGNWTPPNIQAAILNGRLYAIRAEQSEHDYKTKYEGKW
jgi:predicted HAD superfamily Cof-like phosphohydrolase